MLKKSPAYRGVLLHSQQPYSQLDGSNLYPLFPQDPFHCHCYVFPATSGSLKCSLSLTSSQYNFILMLHYPAACRVSHTAPSL